MHIDLRKGEVWEKLSEKAARFIAAPEGSSVRVHQGAFAAVYETVHSLVQLYPHKKSMAVINGATPFFEPLMPYFFRETFQIQNILPSQIESVEGFVGSLQKDTLFVLMCDDHAVTGQLYNFSALEQALADKKIFCIRLSHSQHFYQKNWPKNFSSVIFSVEPDLALSVSGARVKSLVLVSANLQWSSVKVEKSLEAYSQSKTHEDQNAVESFEKALPVGCRPLLKQGTARVFDRSCIVLENVNSEAVQAELAKELNLQIQDPAFENEIESLSACRWNLVREQTWWLDPAPSVTDWQGGLILSVKVLNHPDFKKSLDKVYKGLQAEQA
ncbi:MAG: hypothetical protein AB7O96_10770 [Pseudobdellovibrionaceae bacterium]